MSHCDPKPPMLFTSELPERVPHFLLFRQKGPDTIPELDIPDRVMKKGSQVGETPENY